PRLQRQLYGNSGACQRIAERRAAFRRVAQAEAGDGRVGEAPSAQIVEGAAPGRRCKLLLVPCRGRLHGRDQGRLALGALALLRRGDGKGEARLARQALHRLGEAEALTPHDEADDVAMGAAPEAVEEALLVADGEGGRLLVMKGAEAGAFPPAARELHL